MSFENTLTFANLSKAFSGESQARNRYDFYASIAKEEGFQAIQKIFEATAENEKQHAKVFFKHLAFYAPNSNVIHIDTDYPLNYKDTLSNLKSAANGEKEEWQVLYSNFAATANSESYPDISESFKHIAEVEKHHHFRYKNLADNLENGTLFQKTCETSWKCANCGYVHSSTSAPKTCPACQHPQGYFIDLPQDY
ncbi:MAG: ferritin family protein [Eubacteriales bacterium]